MIDIHSGTWREIRQKALERIENAQRELERTGTCLAETEFHRGRIAAFRAILDMARGDDEPIEPERFHR